MIAAEEIRSKLAQVAAVRKRKQTSAQIPMLKAHEPVINPKANVNPFQDNFTPSTNIKSMSEIASDISPIGKENLGFGEKLARGASAIPAGLSAAAEGLATKPLETAAAFGKGLTEHAVETAALASSKAPGIVPELGVARKILQGAEKLKVPIIGQIEPKLRELEASRLKRYEEDPIQIGMDVLGMVGLPATAAWAVKASKIIKSVPKNIAEVMAKNATEAKTASGKAAQQRERAFFELANEADPTLTREEAKQWIDAINEYDGETKKPQIDPLTSQLDDIPPDMKRLRAEIEVEQTQNQLNQDIPITESGSDAIKARGRAGSRNSLPDEQAGQESKTITKRGGIFRGSKKGNNRQPALYRGQAANGGTGVASFGDGLYSTTDKNLARNYGDPKKVVDGYPNNPLVLRQREDFVDWLLEESGSPNIREFNKSYPDISAFVRSKGYDGVHAGNVVVKYQDLPSSNLSQANAPVNPNRLSQTNQPTPESSPVEKPLLKSNKTQAGATAGESATTSSQITPPTSPVVSNAASQRWGKAKLELVGSDAAGSGAWSETDTGTLKIKLMRSGSESGDVSRGGTWYEVNSFEGKQPTYGAGKPWMKTSPGVGGKERWDVDVELKNPLTVNIDGASEAYYPVRAMKELIGKESADKWVKRLKRNASKDDVERHFAKMELELANEAAKRGHDGIVYYYTLTDGTRAFPDQVFKINATPPVKKPPLKTKTQAGKSDVGRSTQPETPTTPPVEKPVGDVTTKAKEPWEMTRKEFDDALDVEHGTTNNADAESIGRIGLELRPARSPESAPWPESSFFLPKGGRQTDVLYSNKVSGRLNPQSKILREGTKEFSRVSKGIKSPGTSGAPEVAKRAKGLGYDIVAFQREDVGYVAISKNAVDFRSHKSIIEQALKDGKPVPPEVLADYPELQKLVLSKRAKIGQPDAPIAKSVTDGVVGDSEFFSNLTETPAFRDKGLSGLDVPTQRLVISRMIAAAKNPQVRDAIVKFVPIDVIDGLAGIESPTQVLLKNKAVLHDTFAINPDNTISLRVDVANSIMRSLAGARAKGTALSGVDASGLSVNRISAEKTSSVGFHEGNITKTSSDVKTDLAAKYGKPTTAEAKIDPARRRFYAKGMNGQVEVIFPDADHAELAAIQGRIRRSQSGQNPTKDITNYERMKSVFGDNYSADAADYNQFIRDKVKSLNPGDTFNAPTVKEWRAETSKPTSSEVTSAQPADAGGTGTPGKSAIDAESAPASAGEGGAKKPASKPLLRTKAPEKPITPMRRTSTELLNEAESISEGMTVYYQGARHKKPHKGKVKGVVTDSDGNIVRLQVGNDSLKPDQVWLPSKTVESRYRAAAMRGLSKEEKVTVNTAASEFDKLVDDNYGMFVSKDDLHGEYSQKVGETGREYAGNTAVKNKLRDAVAEKLGVDNLSTPIERADALRKLKEHIADNSPDVEDFSIESVEGKLNTSELKPGDQVQMDGEWYKVEEGSVPGTFRLKDGITKTVDDTFDNLTADKVAKSKPELKTEKTPSGEQTLIPGTEQRQVPTKPLLNVGKKVKDIEAQGDVFQPGKIEVGNQKIDQLEIVGPKPSTLSDKIKTIADKAEADAKARLKGKIDGLSSGTKLYDITGAAGDAASMGKDLAIIGAAKIARGAVEFAQWSKAMIDDLGESIRPHLEAIYKRANDEFESMKATTIDEDYIGLNKNQIEKIRKATGLDDLPEPDRARHIDVLHRAKKNGTDKKAMDIARDVKDRPRPLTNEEHAGMVLKTEQLYTDWREATQAASDVIERGGDATDVLARVKNLENDLDLLTEASDLGGREAARSLSIRRMLKAFETDDIIHVRRQATATKGAKLTPEESERFEKLVAEKDEAIKRLDEANAKWQKDYDELQAKQAAALVEHEANRAKITEKIQGKKEKIQSERVDILKQLRERGFETKLNAGLDPQDAFLIGKLGMNYVKGGITNVEEIVRLVMEDVPNLTRRDVLQSFNSKNPDLQAKAKAAAMIQVNRIKKQAELLVKIEDAENGIFSKTRKVLDTTPAEIKALQTKLRELRVASYETIRDADRLERVQKTITDVQNQLQGHYRNIKAKKPVDNEAVAELRGKLKDLRRRMTIEDELAKLEDQLATGDFEIPTELKPRPKSEVLDRAEVDLRRARRVIRDEIEKIRPKSAGEKFLRVSENLRAIKATADLSATLRQGAISVVSHPIKAAQNFVPALKATFSKYKAEQIDMAMRSADAQYLRDKAKLELTNIDGTPTTREEHFAGVWIEKIPALGEVVKASNRHMATFLNLMRTSMFDDFVRKVPNATTEELQAYARWINVTTGRGELGKYAQAGRSLGTVFFAPRFAISRIQTPYVFYKSMKSSPRVRAQVAKEAVAVASTAMGVLALAKMSGAEVGTDPRESDFGKIRLGNERIDIFAGMQQPMRLIVRTALYGTDKAGLTGDWLVNEDTGNLYSDSEFDPVEGWMKFAEFKLSPMITLPRELITGKTAVGEKTETIESLIRASAPMLVESMVEAWKEEGATTAIRSGALNFMGVSSNVYSDSEGRLRRDIRKAEYFKDDKTEDAKRDELAALKEKKKQEDQNRSGKITLNKKAI